jgi:acyl-CoA synthetase (NDP forming)
MRSPDTGRRGLAGIDLIATLSDPRSIAVVGASSRPGSYSSRAVSYLQNYGYAGDLVLVNPNTATVAGLPCVDRVPDGGVDVAFVALPGSRTVEACHELASSGTRAAVVIAADLGDAARHDLRRLAEDSGMRVVGPNCVGVMSVRNHVYTTFSSVLSAGAPRAGGIALATQSGAMGNALMISLLRRGAGLSHWISTGDEVDCGALELITGLLADDQVEVVGAFIEGLTDTEWLHDIKDAVQKTGKQVHVLKGARTVGGRSAAAGHTGRVVGAGEAGVAVLRDAGVTVHDSVAVLADVLVASTVSRRPRGGRVGVVSVSGGAGVLAADAIVQSGRLELADVVGDEDLAARVGGRVHALANPLDVAASPTSVFIDWVTAMASSPSTDLVLALQANVLHNQLELVQGLAAYDGATPIVVVPFCEDDGLSAEHVDILARAKIAVMPTPERAVAAFAAVRPPEPPPPAGHPAHEAGTGGTTASLEAAVAAVGADLPWSGFELVTTLEDAKRAGESFGFPVVVKAAGRTIQHRADVSAVEVGVTAATLRPSFGRIRDIAESAGDAVIVQAQAAPGLELMISVVSDPELGAVAYVRFGGTLAEKLVGVAVVWHGWSPTERRAVIEKSAIGEVLAGYRNTAPRDLTAVCSVVDRLLDRLPASDVELIELNPVIVYADGLALVDALVVRRDRD